MRWCYHPDMRRLCLSAVLLLLVQVLSAASVTGGLSIREDLFWSEEELDKVDFSAPLEDEEREYYENTHIYLVTASPSEPVYVFFGHAGIVVDTPDNEPVMFDYGSFSFDDSFYVNFVLGRLYYRVIETYESYRMASFIMDDRTVERIELTMTPEAKKATIGFLSYNVLPENETYLYNYYTDNCATRLRDIYNAATGGEFREWAESIGQGRSFRAWSTPYMAPSFFFAFILNYLQGPSIDRPVTLWDACFLPDILMQATEIYEGKEADTVYLTKTRTPAPLKYNLTARCFGIAAIAACAILLTASKHKAIRVTGDIISALGWLFMGVLSLILVFVMTATNHDVTYYNFNAFIISPAVLALAVLHAASIGKKERRNAISRLSAVLFAVAAVLLVMKGCIMMTGYTQDNIGYYAIALAAYAAEIAVMKLSSSRRSR